MELPNRICCTLEPPFTRFSWRLSGRKNLNFFKQLPQMHQTSLARNGWLRQNIKPQHSHLQSQVHWSCKHGLNACSMMLSYIVLFSNIGNFATEKQLTAGLARRFVRGKSRVPAPPPRIMEATVLGSLFSVSSSCTWRWLT